MPQPERRKRRDSRGRRPLSERFVGAIRRFLFPRPTVKLGLPHAEHGRRGEIIGFAVALVLLLIAALTVIAVEGGFSPSDTAPVQE